MVCCIQAEVGRVRVAVDVDAVELAAELSGGRENAADAVNGAEVGVVEGVVAGDGGVAGTLVIPWAEATGGVNVAAGNGIGEGRIIGRRAAGSDIVQDDPRDARRLAPSAPDRYPSGSESDQQRGSEELPEAVTAVRPVDTVRFLSCDALTWPEVSRHGENMRKIVP